MYNLFLFQLEDLQMLYGAITVGSVGLLIAIICLIVVLFTIKTGIDTIGKHKPIDLNPM